MGGRHKKFTRKEKSKVKLKTKKTVLTKAQNVTDTSFKVRKIVLKEQLKSAVLNEPQTRRNLSVKELLSRLRHYNSSMQKSSLVGLQELVTQHSEEILGLHLSELIEGTARLILDQENDVRKGALKLLNVVLTQVPESRVMPFFNVLLSYLNCGMTHIHVSIQDDSLAMLDTLLEATPLLVSANADTVLCNFLDMISSLKPGSSSERTLTMNLNSRFTSVAWRMKVLHQLKGLLSALVEYKKHQDRKHSGCLAHPSENTACLRDSWTWKEDSELHIPVYNHHYRDTCYLPNVFSVGNSSDESSSEDKHLKKYVKVLIPLLIETWREVALGQVCKSSNNEVSYSLLSLEAAEVLKCVLEVIQLLCELLTSEVTEFITAHRKDFGYLFFHGFPYSCSQRHEEGVKVRNDMRKQKECLNKDPRCLSQNLAICHLFYCFYDDHNMDVELSSLMLKYVKGSMRNWKEQDDRKQLMQVLRHLLQCPKCWGCHGTNLRKVLDSTVAHYKKTHDQDLFEILSGLSLTAGLTHLYRYASFQEWMESLPDLLCSPTVPATTVEILGKLACQNNPLFCKILCQKLPDILS
ncbi:hypothetical protein B7P43_G03110, partial [Cryptotermes secundus]